MGPCEREMRVVGRESEKRAVGRAVSFGALALEPPLRQWRAEGRAHSDGRGFEQPAPSTKKGAIDRIFASRYNVTVRSSKE
ncbi:hypothetical protein CDAR_223071 [Caerostris darwini]|uniref:Uncharacterized protein n=1 Tax=Caerostris darwini TaxID=1538125 RepID=A0AAV4N985_9ARAC|nr:hypothetical protein CDAR_223071 [Caerostris darwini]